MKQWMLTAILAGGFVVATQAQDRMPQRPAKERIEMQMKWVNKNLTLTPSQATKMKDVLYQFALKRDSIAGAGRPDPSQRGAMRQFKEQRDAAVKAVIPADQFAKWTAHEEEMRQKRGKMPPPPAGGE
ncbi:MAG: hypothetical protein EBZ77_01880 [Chitinophagia bacterium]|nr:hypothetical protein [Chitinophagia bacterium]